MSISAAGGAITSSISPSQLQPGHPSQGWSSQLLGMTNIGRSMVLHAGDEDKNKSNSSGGFNNTMQKVGTTVRVVGEYGIHSGNNKVKVAGAVLVGIGKGMESIYGSRK